MILSPDIFTVCFFISPRTCCALSLQVWDLRMDPSSCIKTLSSSGLTTNGAVVVATSTTGGRSLAPLPPGETQINDIGLTPSGYGLFSAAADKVRCFFNSKSGKGIFDK
jgi:hypothetical protein